MSDDDRDPLSFYRSEIGFEGGMLAGRLNAFVASQSFLVIGYASSMSASLDRWHNAFGLVFPPSLAVLGLAPALCAWPGIEAAYQVIGQWHERQDQLLSRNAGLDEYRRSPTGACAEGGFERGTTFAKYAPKVFAAAWLCFGALPVLFYLRS